MERTYQKEKKTLQHTPSSFSSDLKIENLFKKQNTHI